MTTSQPSARADSSRSPRPGHSSEAPSLGARDIVERSLNIARRISASIPTANLVIEELRQAQRPDPRLRANMSSL